MSLSMDEWTYNTNFADSPNGGIHVGTRAAVPEPASTLPAIALLAAGAAGVRSWRKRKAATTAH